MVRMVVSNAQSGAQDFEQWSERSSHSVLAEMHTLTLYGHQRTEGNRKRSNENIEFADVIIFD